MLDNDCGNVVGRRKVPQALKCLVEDKKIEDGLLTPTGSRRVLAFFLGWGIPVGQFLGVRCPLHAGIGCSLNGDHHFRSSVLSGTPLGSASSRGGPASATIVRMQQKRSEERRVGKECRSRWSP